MTLTRHPLIATPESGVIAGPLGFYAASIYGLVIGNRRDGKSEAIDDLEKMRGVKLSPCPFSAAQAGQSLMFQDVSGFDE